MKAYLQRVSAGALLIFLALFSGLFSLRDCFALSADPTLLFWACVVTALIASAILALPGSLSSWLALLAVALCILVLAWDFDPFLKGAQVVFHQISLGFHQEMPTILYYELPPALEAASYARLTRLATRFLIQCLPLVALWLGVWLVQSRCVWPALVAALFLPALGLFVLREPGPLPIAALLLFLALVILTRRSLGQSPVSGSRRVWLSVPPLILIMALLALLFPQETYQRWDWIETQRLRAISWTTSIPGPGSPSGTASNAGAQSFRYSGPLRFDGHTVLHVTSDQDAAALYLKGFSAGVYTKTGWQPIEASLPDLPAPDSPWTSPAHAQVGGATSFQSASVTVTDVDVGTRYAYLPYYPLSAPQDAAITADSYMERPSGTDTWVVSYLPEINQNTTVSMGWEEAYRDYVYDNYLDVPEAVLTQEALDIIQTYAHSVRIDSAELSQMAYRQTLAEDVRRFLASFTTYDQNVSATPYGEDLVSRFLTQTHRGYCLHYASAATLILREMGIPTRYVAGYVAQNVRENVLTEVPDRAAHAWVEVYVDGLGWIPQDVTPGFSGDLSPVSTPTPTPSSTPSPTPTPKPTPTPPTATPSPTPPPSQPHPVESPKGPTLPWKQIIGWTLGISSIAAVFLLQRQYRLKKREKACTQQDPNQAALALYRYLRAVEEKTGYEIPKKAFDLAQKAAFSQHILTDDERRAMEGFAQAAAQAARSQPFFKGFVLRYVFALI